MDREKFAVLFVGGAGRERAEAMRELAGLLALGGAAPGPPLRLEGGRDLSRAAKAGPWPLLADCGEKMDQGPEARLGGVVVVLAGWAGAAPALDVNFSPGAPALINAGAVAEHLEALGCLAPPPTGYEAGEEEEVARRLASLGYI